MEFAEAKPLAFVLNEIVARVRKFTNADGAAIAIRDGDFVVTRATTGGIAPDLGARISIQGSFTGLCLEKHTMLQCEDSDVDVRVDAKTCRQLNTRSFVVVPIEGAKQPQGVLAAFSSAPHAFTRTDIAVLKTAADQIRQAILNTSVEDAKSAPPLEPIVEEEVEQQQKSPLEVRLAELTKIAAAAAPPEKPVAPAATAVRSSQTKITERRPSVAPKPRATVRPAASSTAKPREPALVSLAESIEAPKAELATPPPLNEQLPEGFREQYLGWKGFATPEPAPRISRKWFVGAAAVCVLLVATVAFSVRRPVTSANKPAATPDSSSVSAAEPLAPAPSQPAPTSVSLPVITPAMKPRPAVEPVERTSSAAKNIPVEKQPVLVVGSSAPKPRTADVPDTEAPEVSIASSNTSVLPDMKQIAPGAPKPPVARLSDVESSELIRKVVPLFPRFTNAAPGTQTVVLRARVLADGSVGDVQVIQGRPEFGESAKTAVKQWRYKPARIDGKPVETSVTVTLNFRR